MIKRVLIVALWLACGAVVIGAAYWQFLGTPESSVLMLVVSAALALAIGIVAAVVGNTALLVALDEPLRRSVTRGLRHVHWFLVPMLLVLLGVAATRNADDWMARSAGEISAWFISTLDWTDVDPLFRLAAYLTEWLRWVIVPLAALAAMTAILRRGARTLRSTRWVRAAWGWRTVLVATAAYVLLIVLPWRVALWRPEGVPSTWVEPTLAALRLLLAGGAMAIGVAVVMVAVARAVDAALPATPAH